MMVDEDLKLVEEEMGIRVPSARSKISALSRVEH